MALVVSPKEKQRLSFLKRIENDAKRKGYNIIAGIDEAGRGPLAGPVVAAACVIPDDFCIAGVDDSKKLTPALRNQIYEEILLDPRIQCGVGVVNHDVVDAINIYQATIKAMLLALDDLPVIPSLALVDGMQLSGLSFPCEKIIKGDSKSLSIAAASIIAKETRDRLMVHYDEMWPEYGFAKHKGYGTVAHREAIEKYGVCSIHRTSFEPIKSLLMEEELSLAY